MNNPARDERSPQRRTIDERIAAEPMKSPLDLPVDTAPKPVVSHLDRRRHPVALAGIVENGLVRPLDSSVKLPEHSRVIIVASEGA